MIELTSVIDEAEDMKAILGNICGVAVSLITQNLKMNIKILLFVIENFNIVKL